MELTDRTPGAGDRGLVVVGNVIFPTESDRSNLHSGGASRTRSTLWPRGVWVVARRPWSRGGFPVPVAVWVVACRPWSQGAFPVPVAVWVHGGRGATRFCCVEMFVNPFRIVQKAGITRTVPSCLLIVLRVLLPWQAGLEGNAVMAGSCSSSGPTHALLGVAGRLLLTGGTAGFLDWRQPILGTGRTKVG